MSTVRLIINPAASNVTAKARSAVHEALAAHEVVEVETKARDHARELAHEAALEGVDAVVVLGGDGTVNEAANGILDAGESNTTALAALPGGSTNVFARTIGLPRKAGKAAAVIAGSLERTSVRRMPIGRANGRAFLFHAGIGFDAAVVEQVERRSSLKRTIGQAIFVYAAFATWFRHFDHTSAQFRLDGTDGAEGGVDGSFAIVLNTNPYTYLGLRPLNVAPGADGEHGLTAVTVRKVGVMSLLGVFSRALGSGRRVERHRQVDVRRDATQFSVHAYTPVPVQLDGDFIGRLDEVVLVHEPDRLLVVVP